MMMDRDIQVREARQVSRRLAAAVLLAAALLSASACKPKGAAGRNAAATGKAAVSIAVFIPGALSGSPIYEMLASGVERAVAEADGVSVRVIEGGYNQAEWEEKLSSLAAGGSYSLIVSANPSLPQLAAAVRAKFPAQRFLLLDGELSGDAGIYTLRYRQREQAYMAGYLAALLAVEAGRTRVGLIAGQEYPVMTDTILPAYREGVAAACALTPGREVAVDFRVVGNWFDAAKGAELADGMIASGDYVLLCIAGGANEGAVQAASEAGAKVIWFDSNGYALRPPVVAGSLVVRQDEAAYAKTKLFLEGGLPFGTAEAVGVREGYIDFIDDDPLYEAAVSADVRAKQGEMLTRLRSGALVLPE